MKWINSWGNRFYLDARQSADSGGQRWCMPKGKDGKKFPLSSEYIYNIQDPYSPLNEGKEPLVGMDVIKERMVGIEAPLWTEQVGNEEKATARTWPRLSVASEHMWRKPRAEKDWSESWDAYRFRLQDHMKRFDAQGVTDYFKVE